tara:strand:+ start:237 stop:533 length:297 start_codon:yes stop_codon:yes gene_type:complete
MDYLQLALAHFNKDKSQWYGWKTHDDDGNKILNSQRMQYQYIKLNDETATMPTEAEVNAKIQELKDAEANAENLKASAKAKLIAGEPLTEEEANTIVL